MNAVRRQYFEQRLLSERRRLSAQLERLNEQARDGDDAGADAARHFADVSDDGTHRAARALAIAMAAHEASEIAAIDTALRLLYEQPERYGRCVDCGRPIPSGRVDILPWAIRCERHEDLRTGGGWRAPASHNPYNFTTSRAHVARSRRRS